MPSHKQDLRYTRSFPVDCTISYWSRLFPPVLLLSHLFFSFQAIGLSLAAEDEEELRGNLGGKGGNASCLGAFITSDQIRSGCDLNERTDLNRTQRYRTQSAPRHHNERSCRNERPPFIPNSWVSSSQTGSETEGTALCIPAGRLTANTCNLLEKQGRFSAHSHLICPPVLFGPVLPLPRLPRYYRPRVQMYVPRYLSLPTASLYGVLLFLPPVTLPRNLFLHSTGRFGHWPRLFPFLPCSSPLLPSREKEKKKETL